MKKTHFANLLAVGVGMASMTANAEVTCNSVFGMQPMEINLQLCEASHLSLSNVHQMINQRNNRDTEIIRSSADNMLHL